MLPGNPVIWIQTTWEGGKHPIKVAPYTRSMLDTYRNNVTACLILSTSRQKGSFAVASTDKFLYALAPLPYALSLIHISIVFCIAMILTYAFGFNMLASYNLQSTFSGFSFYDPKVSPWIIGGILAVLTGWCLLGGGSRIVKVTSTLVPVKMCIRDRYRNGM